MAPHFLQRDLKTPWHGIHVPSQPCLKEPFHSSIINHHLCTEHSPLCQLFWDSVLCSFHFLCLKLFSFHVWLSSTFHAKSGSSIILSVPLVEKLSPLTRYVHHSYQTRKNLWAETKCYSSFYAWYQGYRGMKYIGGLDHNIEPHPTSQCAKNNIS